MRRDLVARRGDALDLGGGLGARGAHPRERGANLVAQGLHAVDQHGVRLVDLLEVLGTGQQVAEAVGLEQHRREVGRVALVDRDQPARQHALRRGGSGPAPSRGAPAPPSRAPRAPARGRRCGRGPPRAPAGAGRGGGLLLLRRELARCGSGARTRGSAPPSWRCPRAPGASPMSAAWADGATASTTSTRLESHARRRRGNAAGGCPGDGSMLLQCLRG